jgi:alkylhydroperoxidase/carboxymuconolactone decarboxylase family protein YurZ
MIAADCRRPGKSAKLIKERREAFTKTITTGKELENMAAIKNKHYLKVKNRFPDFLGAVEALGTTARKEGPIDEKNAQLIQLAGAAALRSEGAVHSHTRRALEAGAEVDEIYHALILLTSTIGFPNIMAALSWAEDVIENPE